MNPNLDRLDRIDAALDRLTERHQALTETVELLVAEHRALADQHRALADQHRELEKLIAARFTETLGFINQLARVAESHEERIHHLEQDKK
jgi:hypothetical protein